MLDKEGVNLSMAVHHFSLNSHSKDMGEFSGTNTSDRRRGGTACAQQWGKYVPRTLLYIHRLPIVSDLRRFSHYKQYFVNLCFKHLGGIRLPETNGDFCTLSH